jgi:hypothetical protein
MGKVCTRACRNATNGWCWWVNELPRVTACTWASQYTNTVPTIATESSAVELVCPAP